MVAAPDDQQQYVQVPGPHWCTPIFVTGLPGAGKSEAVRALFELSDIVIIENYSVIRQLVVPHENRRRWMVMVFEYQAEAHGRRHSVPGIASVPIIHIERNPPNVYPRVFSPDTVILNNGTVAELHAAFLAAFNHHAALLALDALVA